MERNPPPPAGNVEGSLVDVTPHPDNRATPKKPKMNPILLEALLTAGISSLPIKRQAIQSLTHGDRTKPEYGHFLMG
jgi:hypothetical protein